MNSITERNFDKHTLKLLQLFFENLGYIYYLYEVNYLNKNDHALVAMFINYLIDIFICDKIYVLHHFAVMCTILTKYLNLYKQEYFYNISVIMINCEFSTIFLNNYFMLNYIKKNKVILWNKNITCSIINSKIYNILMNINKILLVSLFIKLRAYDYLTKIILNKYFYELGAGCYSNNEILNCVQYAPWYFGMFTLYGLHVYWTYEVINKFVFGKSKNKIS